MLATLCLLLPVAAFAQQPPADQVASAPPVTLTLRDAIGRASRQNLDLATARLRRAVSQAGIRIARQIPNPTFNFTALRDTPHEGLFFDQPVEIGGKRGRRIELARQEDLLSGVEIDSVARQVRRRVREAYHAAAPPPAFTAHPPRPLALPRPAPETPQP